MFNNSKQKVTISKHLKMFSNCKPEKGMFLQHLKMLNNVKHKNEIILKHLKMFKNYQPISNNFLTSQDVQIARKKSNK